MVDVSRTFFRIVLQVVESLSSATFSSFRALTKSQNWLLSPVVLKIKYQSVIEILRENTPLQGIPFWPNSRDQ